MTKYKRAWTEDKKIKKLTPLSFAISHLLCYIAFEITQEQGPVFQYNPIHILHKYFLIMVMGLPFCGMLLITHSPYFRDEPFNPPRPAALCHPFQLAEQPPRQRPRQSTKHFNIYYIYTRQSTLTSYYNRHLGTPRLTSYWVYRSAPRHWEGAQDLAIPRLLNLYTIFYILIIKCQQQHPYLKTATKRKSKSRPYRWKNSTLV